MKINKQILIFSFSCLLFFYSCDKEELNESIIDTSKGEQTELDTWIDRTFRKPYNIYVEYEWNSTDVDQSKNLVPPIISKVKPFLKTVEKIWLNTYNSVAESEDDFMKDYTCRKLKLVGSGSYNNNSVTLGYAENGYKITLYTINSFNLEAGLSRDNLREYFRVMHHEFGHILNQRKPYDTDFQNITGNYSSDWTSYTDAKARNEGFISAYARSEAGEDFVEVLSFYITYTPSEWRALIKTINNQDARNAIAQKLLVVQKYMQDSYGVDIDKLRDAVTTAINEVAEGNLE